MGTEPGISLTFTDGTCLNDAGPAGELRLDGNVLSNYGDEAAYYSSGDGKWHITNGDAIGQPSLTGTSWPSVILGQAKLAE